VRSGSLAQTERARDEAHGELENGRAVDHGYWLLWNVQNWTDIILLYCNNAANMGPPGTPNVNTAVDKHQNLSAAYLTTLYEQSDNL
jgi:hypothetical protein